jgi:hypothetical protein
MTEPLQPAAATAHERHDRELISALAARTADLSARDLATARELVDHCSGCRDLLADLLALQVALPATSTPSRPRDFTLTAADVARLRGGGWRRAIGFFGSARDGISRPLAIGFTTIGLAALLFTALPTLPLGGAGGAASASAAPAAAPAAPTAEPQREAEGARTAASPAASIAAGQSAPAPAASGGPDTITMSAEPDRTGVENGVFSGSNDTDTQSESTPLDEPTGDAGLLSLRNEDGPSLGIVIGGISLILGFCLFALRWTSRRLGAS